MKRKIFVFLPAFFLPTFFLLSACSSSTKKEKNIVTVPDLPEADILQNAINTYDEQLFKVSLQSWTELRDGYPTSYFSTLAELKIADALFYSGDYPAALTSYEEFSKLHPGHEAMPYVRYQIGNSHMQQYKDIKHDQAPLQSAVRAFEHLLEQFPRSEYVVLARRQLQRCRELQAEYERYVAEFYTKRGYEIAANSRLKNLSEAYPESHALVLAQNRISSLPKSDASTSPSPTGKIPTTPKIIDSTLFQSTMYDASLESIRTNQPGSSVGEENIIEEKQAELPAVERTEVIESFECEETEQGAFFIATLGTPILAGGEEKDDGWYLPYSSNSVVKTGNDRCKAGGTTVEIQAGEKGIRLILNNEKKKSASMMVLNRPDRIAIEIR